MVQQSRMYDSMGNEKRTGAAPSIPWAVDCCFAIASIFGACLAFSMVPRSIPGYYITLPSQVAPKAPTKDCEAFGSPIGKVFEDPARTDMTITDLLRTYTVFPRVALPLVYFPQPTGDLIHIAIQVLLSGIYAAAYFTFPFFAIRLACRWLGLVLSSGRLFLLQSTLRESDEPIPTRLFSVAWVLLPVAILIANGSGQLPLPAFAIGYLCLVAIMSLQAFSNYVFDKTEAIQQRTPGGEDVDAANGASPSRIPERILVQDSLRGGWLGALAGQQLLRHKTSDRKSAFRAKSRAAFVLHLVLVAVVAAGAIWNTAERLKLRLREEQHHLATVLLSDWWTNRRAQFSQPLWALGYRGAQTTFPLGAVVLLRHSQPGSSTLIACAFSDGDASPAVKQWRVSDPPFDTTDTNGLLAMHRDLATVSTELDRFLRAHKVKLAVVEQFKAKSADESQEVVAQLIKMSRRDTLPQMLEVYDAPFDAYQ
ncbi:MAG: DUF1294 domain-containing protein [Planctomycetota bacterium]|nr:DUF1294 domain-containing protein [Planctomycetota bacterium]